MSNKYKFLNDDVIRWKRYLMMNIKTMTSLNVPDAEKGNK